MEDSNFAYVPSINLYFARKQSLLSEIGSDYKKILHQKGQRIATPFEFKEFVKYTQNNDKNLFNEVVRVGEPWRMSLLDSLFVPTKSKLGFYFHSFDYKGRISPRLEFLNENTLIGERFPGISFENWLNDSTEQGFPKQDADFGDLNYRSPKDYKSVAMFAASPEGICLSCDVTPDYENPAIGVWIVKSHLE